MVFYTYRVKLAINQNLNKVEDTKELEENLNSILKSYDTSAEYDVEITQDNIIIISYEAFMADTIMPELKQKIELLLLSDDSFIFKRIDRVDPLSEDLIEPYLDIYYGEYF
jgi:hypothetical protein